MTVYSCGICTSLIGKDQYRTHSCTAAAFYSFVLPEKSTLIN